MNIGAALFRHAARRFLFGNFQLLDADELFLECLRRTGGVADLVGASGIGHLDVLIAVSDFEQHLADTPDRLDDGKRAEQRDTAEHGDHEQADAEIDAADMFALGAGLRFALLGRIDQIAGRFLDQSVHLIADFAGVLDHCDGVAVILRGDGELTADADIVGGKRIELFKLCSVGQGVAERDRSLDMRRGSRGIGAQALERTVDVAWRDGKTHLAQFEPHVAEVLRRAQRLDRRELLAVGELAQASRGAIADLLLGEHSGDQKHAKRRPDRELRADGQIEARHLLHLTWQQD